MSGRVVRSLITALVVCFASVLIVAWVSMAYAARSVQASERRWCELVATLDDAYRQQPPTTPTGQKVAAAIARQRAEFGCEVK